MSAVAVAVAESAEMRIRASRLTSATAQSVRHCLSPDRWEEWFSADQVEADGEEVQLRWIRALDLHIRLQVREVGDLVQITLVEGHLANCQLTITTVEHTGSAGPLEVAVDGLLDFMWPLPAPLARTLQTTRLQDWLEALVSASEQGGRLESEQSGD